MGEVMKPRGEEFVDRGAAIFITASADEPGGLVHDDGLDLHGLDAFAASLDEVLRLDSVTWV